jgi:hypothetical protein
VDYSRLSGVVARAVPGAACDDGAQDRQKERRVKSVNEPREHVMTACRRFGAACCQTSKRKHRSSSGTDGKALEKRGGNGWQETSHAEPGKPLEQSDSFATGCHRLP